MTVGRARGGCGWLRRPRGGWGRVLLLQDGRKKGTGRNVAGAGQLDHGGRVEDDHGGQDDHGDGRGGFKSLAPNQIALFARFLLLSPVELA